MIEVFHWAERPYTYAEGVFGFMLDMDQARAIWEGKSVTLVYNKVADVHTDDLEQAFELTNNINRPWSENEGVVAVEGGTRSTSTGDIMKMADGSLHLVASYGFVKLDV